MDRLSGYNAAVYDNLPVSVIIYRVTEEDGAHDYEIVYGNRAFDRDFRRIYGHGDYLGTQAVRNRLIDERTLRMMESFRSGAPRAFSTYIPHANLHVHMEPLTDLPKGYLGFVVTNIADYDEQESRVHFLRVVSQMNNNACLYEMNADGTLSTVYVTPAFCDMMGAAPGRTP